MKVSELQVSNKASAFRSLRMFFTETGVTVAFHGHNERNPSDCDSSFDDFAPSIRSFSV